jgi:hypothetical protein
VHDLVEERFQRLRHLLDGASRGGELGWHDPNRQSLPLLLKFDLQPWITHLVTLEEVSHVLEHVGSVEEWLRTLRRTFPDVDDLHSATVAIFIAVGTGSGLT